jgi:hypothetical protein
MARTALFAPSRLAKRSLRQRLQAKVTAGSPPMRKLGGMTASLSRFRPLLLAAALLAACTGNGPSTPPVSPQGQAPTAKTQALKAGAAMLQDNGPLAKMVVYLVGFHPMKDDPADQMEAHHYCRQVNEDFAQCALFDSNTAQANLTGIEYIISERLFDQLPPDEKPYWHPHNGEILSGQLVAPGLPRAAENALMRTKINSYGKTWHTWMTREGEQPGQSLPLGPPKLAWSFNREGEAQPGLVEARDRRMHVSTADAREARADMIKLAHPQEGVDTLKGQFGRPARTIPGVTDRHPAPASTSTSRD